MSAVEALSPGYRTQLEPLAISGSKGGESNQTTPAESPDSLRSISKAKILLAISEGEIQGELTGKDIYLDKTPLVDASGNENFPGVKWDFRPGTVHQSYIPGIAAVENEVSVGVELTSAVPYTRLITNSQLSAVRVRFRWPALQQQLSNGDITGYRIAYAIDIATDGGAYETLKNSAVDGKTTQAYERSHRITLPTGSNWQIRIRRLTANANNNQIADAMFITAITDIVDRKFRHPNTALLYVEFDASQFQNIPQVACEPKGRIARVPVNYDPETRDYTGVWDGSFKWAYTDNPAWVSYDITLNDRFGTGARLNASMVDKWELYLIAQYCDQLVPDGKGGMEPRYICNVYIQTAAEAWQVLRDIASIYRGMTYWAGGQMVNIADMPRELDYTYSKSNVIDGKFTYASNSEKVRYTRSLISYDNPENGYESDVTSVGDPKLQRRYGDRVIELSALGCTRESEAQRRGKWAILTNNSDRTVSFAVGLDGRITPPGWVIGVADNKLSGRVIAGRIAAATLNTVTLDRDATANPGDRLIINLPSGKAEARTVQSAAGRVITLTVNYSELPVPQLQWAIEADDLAVQQFRVVRLAKTDNTYEITAVQHNPSKYAFIDTGAKLEERPISVLPIGAIPAPASVTISQSVLTEQTMAVTTMTIEWSPVENAAAYEVEWRKDNGNWIKIPRTGETSTDIKGVYTGQYLARVRAISAADVMSVPRSSLLTNIVGKTGAPPALASFTTVSVVFGINLNWSFAAGSEDTLRTEIEYASNSGGTGAIKLGDFAYPIASHALRALSAGATLWFRARIVDRSGNVGPFTAWIQGQASANQAAYDEYFSEVISESALNQQLQEKIEKIEPLENAVGQIVIDVGEINVNIGGIEEQINIIEAELAEIVGAPDWDNGTAYLEGQLVKFDGALYRAVQDVPAGTPVSNELYWEKIGDYASLGEAVAALAVQVSDLDTSVSEIDGQLQAVSTRTDTLAAAWRDEDTGDGRLADVLSGWKNKAAIRTERTVRASQNEALAQQITTVTAAVGGNAAAIQQEATTRANADSSLASQIDTVVSTVGDNTAAIQQEATTRADADTALASQIDTLTSSVGDNAAAIQQEATTRADADSALASQISTIGSTVGDNTAAIQQEATTRANADTALAGQITTLSSTVGDNTAAIQQEATTRASADSALAQQTSTLSAAWRDQDSGDGRLADVLSGWKSKAAIRNERIVRADAVSALAQDITTVTAEVQGQSAAVQQSLTALASLEDGLQAMWSVKLGVTQDGKYYAAGIGLGIENTDIGLQSQFLVWADRFAIINQIAGTSTVTAPFVVQGGQTFISQAMIGNAWITNAMIGDIIQSNNYVAGTTGWRLNKNGTFEINGPVAGQGRMKITNQLIEIFDNSNTLRVRLGIWS